MKYDKPHLTFTQQLELLESRGLACTDEGRALQMLASIGYYRLSAYVYPFRELLSEGERSETHFRSSTIRRGVVWSDVESVWNFDRQLRLLCLDALEIIEIGARTQIAYVLGDRDPFGHVNWESLNQSRCERTLSDGKTAFESWCDRYDRHVHEAARTEDFVKHFLLAYPQSEIPIWAACEFLSFGTLVELYGLMKDEDQTAVARALGVSGGARMRSFLHVMSYVRNVCAHHGRLWNRVLTVKLAKFHKNEVGPDLAHLAGRPLSPKLYPVLAVMAYLVRTIAPDSRWPLRLRELFKKQFPTVPTCRILSTWAVRLIGGNCRSGATCRGPQASGSHPPG